MQQHILKNHSQSQSPEPLNEEEVMARQVSSRMQECPPSDMAQDSGMVTMITSKVAGVDNIDNFKMGDLIESGEFESIYKDCFVCGLLGINWSINKNYIYCN